MKLTLTLIITLMLIGIPVESFAKSYRYSKKHNHSYKDNSKNKHQSYDTNLYKPRYVQYYGPYYKIYIGKDYGKIVYLPHGDTDRHLKKSYNKYKRRHARDHKSYDRYAKRHHRGCFY